MNADKLQTLFFKTIELRKRLDHNLNSLADNLGVNRSELIFLLDVLEHPQTSMKEVCVRTGQEKSAVSKMIDRLQARHLIQSVVCPSNRREIRLSVGEAFDQTKFCWTDAGSKLFPHAQGASDETLDAMIEMSEQLTAWLR